MADPENPTTGGTVPRHWETFLDTPDDEADLLTARVVLVPVPYDATTSYRSGARHGPRAIISASRHLEDYDLELDRDISCVGIHTAPEVVPDVSGPERMIERVRRAVSSYASSAGDTLERRLVGLLGGEHTIAVGAVQALAEIYPDLSVLFLDAHADLRDEYMGTRWGHASVARRIRDICQLVQVGVRCLSAPEAEFIREQEVPVVFWRHGMSAGADLASRVFEPLSRHVYVSIDLDVFDPSEMAAVGTPEPGGMRWEDVTGLLRAVAGHREIVGFDVTELSPAEGPESCAYTAAKLTYKLIGYATSP